MNMKLGGIEMGNEDVCNFLSRCIEYAEDSIARKEKRGESEQMIGEWKTYREFTAHALEEVKNGVLDKWFDIQPSTEDLQEIAFDTLDHKTRSTWLSGLISPRPVVMISTRDADGVENIAPYTSVSLVSNTPALLTVSMSINREGDPRDTFRNLVEQGECELQILSASRSAIEQVRIAAAPLEGSEWEALDLEPPVHPLAAAVISCKLVEVIDLPKGAVAKLVILEVVGIQTRSNEIPLQGLNILCQHGQDRITPTPNSWSELITTHYS
jgi:flavin reductase (DIM6/NTAB) family NADH-FMN oxidoreductase RutF